MKTNLTNQAEAVTIETHTGMAVAHYLATMRKKMTIKNLAIKMNHPDTGLIYRRLKHATTQSVSSKLFLYLNW